MRKTCMTLSCKAACSDGFSVPEPICRGVGFIEISERCDAVVGKERKHLYRGHIFLSTATEAVLKTEQSAPRHPSSVQQQHNNAVLTTAVPLHRLLGLLRAARTEYIIITSPKT